MSDAQPDEAPMGAPPVVGKKVISATQAKDFVAEQKKRGIIYLSRIPRFMKPITVRQRLEKFGEVTRVYILPEDPAVRMARIRRGGSKRENWLEGWIEFKRKREAREIAEHLNTTAVDPKGKGMYGGELWTMKYLKGFKWSHLKEKIAFDKRMRAAKVRTQIAQVRSETEDYKSRADMAERLGRKGQLQPAADATAGAAAAATGGKVGGSKRGFNQLTPLNADGDAVAAYSGKGAGTTDGFDRGAARKEGGGKLSTELLGKVFGTSSAPSSSKKKRSA